VCVCVCVCVYSLCALMQDDRNGMWLIK